MCCAVPIEEEVFDKDSIRGMEETPLPYRRLMRPNERKIIRIRDQFPALARRFNNKPVVYFDNACSSLRPRPVIDALTSYYENSAGCHGRVDHHFGQETTLAYNCARSQVQEYIGALLPSEVVFLRNTTEAINLVANVFPLSAGDVVLTSDLEHNSNLLPWQALRDRKGIEHRIFKTRTDTSFDRDSFIEALDNGVKLVSVLLSSNLSGVSFPIKEIIDRAHAVGARVLVDAAQGILYKDVNVQALDVDFMAFSGHKLLGPTGTGVLYIKQELLEELPNFLMGGETVTDTTYTGYTLGGAPDRFEAGLQDYAGAVGLGAACMYLSEIGKPFIRERIARLNGEATEELRCIDRVKVIGPADPVNRGGILNFTVDNMNAHDVAYLLNKSNIMVRAGKHCVHSWYNARECAESVRASFSFYNTPEEVDFFCWTMRDIVRMYGKGSYRMSQ